MANMEPKVDYSKRSTRYNKLYPENEELYSWLRKEMPEEIIEPKRPIIDPHHHLWDRRGSTKRWRQQVYLLPEILEDVYDGHNVVATVFVQAGAFLYKQSTPPEFQGLGEVEFCQGIAAMTSSQIYGNTRINCGIQGSVDLTHPNCENVLKAMMGSRNFRGVRGYMPNRNDDYNDDFKHGMRILEKYDLVLDRWDENVANIPQLTRLAKEFPNVRIVLDHLGGAVGPNLSPVEVEQWKKDITEIGKCENVYCKVGGIQMVVNGFGLHERDTPIGSEELAELTFPWYSHVIDSFGPSRCMFESNFPVDKDSVSYRTLWNMFKRIANMKQLSESEKQDIFHNTAMNVYKLHIGLDSVPPLARM